MTKKSTPFIIEYKILEKYTGTDETVCLPEDIEFMKWHAFFNAPTVKSLIVPDHVFINWNDLFCFNGIPHVTELTVSSKHFLDLTDPFIPRDAYDARIEAALMLCHSKSNVDIVHFSDTGETVYVRGKNEKTVSVPDSVSWIGPEAFIRRHVPHLSSSQAPSQLASVIIPPSVKRIGYRAFAGCTSLTELALPDSIETIRACAFSGCSSLPEITLPSQLKKIDWYTFLGCLSLKKVVIPEGVTEIGKSAFEGCTSLTELVIPSSVTKIGEYAFSGCSALKAIHFRGSSMIEMGQCVFWDINAPLEITFGGTSEVWAKTVSANYIPPPYEFMYGERCIGEYEFPMGHPQENDFVCNVFCEQDQKRSICRGTKKDERRW